MARSSVGLVLRTNRVQVYKAHRGLVGGIRFSKIVTVPIAGPEDPQIMQAIRTALASASVKTSRLALSLPPQEVLLRSFTMPLLPKQEWRTAVGFEARKYIPFKTEELAWGFHAAEQRSAKQMAVAFMGVRTERLTRIQEWLAAAGIKHAVVEAQAVSLSRLVQMPKASSSPSAPEAWAGATTAQTDNQFLGIVDVDTEANVAHLVIAKDHVPYLARDIDLKLKLEGVSAGPQTADSRAEVLSSELRLSCDFFTRENPQAVISQLVLFGEEATIGPWVSWLASQLHCSVALGRLPAEIGPAQGLSLGHAAAVGLALRDLRPGVVKIDLLAKRPDRPASKTQLAGLSRHLSPQFLQALVKTVAVQIAVALVALAALTRVVGDPRIARFQQEMAQVIGAFPDVGWGLKHKTAEELQALDQRLKAHLAFLHTVIRDRVSVTEKLDALAKALPDGVWLEGFRYQDRLDRMGPSQASLTLRGACFLPDSEEELEVISEFVQRIKRDQVFFRGFTTAHLSEITAAQDRANRYSYRTFGLNCQAERRL